MARPGCSLTLYDRPQDLSQDDDFLAHVLLVRPLRPARLALPPLPHSPSGSRPGLGPLQPSERATLTPPWSSPALCSPPQDCLALPGRTRLGVHYA